jgi:hypothetical protein
MKAVPRTAGVGRDDPFTRGESDGACRSAPSAQPRFIGTSCFFNAAIVVVWVLELRVLHPLMFPYPVHNTCVLGNYPQICALDRIWSFYQAHTAPVGWGTPIVACRQTPCDGFIPAINRADTPIRDLGARQHQASQTIPPRSVCPICVGRSDRGLWVCSIRSCVVINLRCTQAARTGSLTRDHDSAHCIRARIGHPSIPACGQQAGRAHQPTTGGVWKQPIRSMLNGHGRI